MSQISKVVYFLSELELQVISQDCFKKVPNIFMYAGLWTLANWTTTNPLDFAPCFARVRCEFY